MLNVLEFVFALSGDKNTQSHLFVNGSMGGIISKTKNFSVKDTSVSININKDTDIDYGYTHASGEGVVGLGALGGNVDLVNSNGTDKNLVISLSLGLGLRGDVENQEQPRLRPS